MAKILVSPDLLASVLFPGTNAPVEIIGASFNPDDRGVCLEIVGLDVPETEIVTAMVTIEVRRTHFDKA